MKKFYLVFVAVILSATTLSGCSFDGSYRYPCQDPANWETPECKPPLCETNGACPVDLVGEDIFNGTTNDAETQDESLVVEDGGENE